MGSLTYSINCANICFMQFNHAQISYGTKVASPAAVLVRGFHMSKSLCLAQSV